MPYVIRKVKGGYKVKGPGGFKSKKPKSKAAARRQQKALYVHAAPAKERKRRR